MRRSRPYRSRSELSESFVARLNSYTATAVATGVGVLTLAPTATARIVYTPANTRIPHNGHINIDIDHNGTADFAISLGSVRPRSVQTNSFLSIAPINGENQFWRSGTFAVALPKGVRVDSAGRFSNSRAYMATASQVYTRRRGRGPWSGEKTAYLGLKFEVQGKTHFGWARLHVVAPTKKGTPDLIKAILTGYAYETIPNKPIVTGKTKGPDSSSLQPATLGRLSQGASAISDWRK